MDKGLSLVELLVALTCSSLLILALYQSYQLSAATHDQMRSTWYCMQSLRQAAVHLSADLQQCACLLPQDLKLAVEDGRLYIAGVPRTSDHPGISPSRTAPPPYYALVVSRTGSRIELDTVDIDGDARADFWADLGLIADSGPLIAGHAYSRGSISIPLLCRRQPSPGDRVVPAVWYELKEDGLHRNGQLLAEAVVGFHPSIAGNRLTVFLRSRYHGMEKGLTVSYAF
jgi:hypothetical protein